MTASVTYTAAPTLSAFHQSDAKIRGVMGPVGSGKSTACSAEIMMRAHNQEPSPIDGLRHTRWAVVRNTYRELSDTTIKTWLDWFGQAGILNRNDMTFHARFNDVDLEVMFRALDRPGDVKKLLSMELTGAWFNEAREMPKSLVDAMDDRIGRYPAVKDGGCTWRGIIMDTNPPDSDHWWYRLAEEERPQGWAFFRQPGGLMEIDGSFFPNPEAENLENLEADYYVNRQPGKSLDHIRVFYCAQYGFVIEGRPVIPEYADALHCPHQAIAADRRLPIRVGIDWGLTPAAVFGQQLPSGRWIIVHEITTERMGARNFGGLFAKNLNEFFADFEVCNPTGDPSGTSDSTTDEESVFEVFNAALKAAGVSLRAVPAPTNDAEIRHGALGYTLSRIIDGRPGLLVSPVCRVLRKGLAGGYCYKRLAVTGQERYHDKPLKNKYSHPVEALEYMLIGAGEGRTLVRAGKPQPRPRVISDFDPIGYEKSPQRLVRRFDFDPYKDRG